MNNLLVSIITPSLNQGTYIQETIQSVLTQNYPNIEYIVMDGGSTDNTKSILKKYGSRIRWISKKDNGQADAINKGMHLAKGEILCYLNSDDYLLPGAIANVVERFLFHPDVGWITGDYTIVNGKGEQIQQLISLYKRILRKFHIPLLFTNSIIQPSTFWRRQLMKQAGEFDSSLHYTFDYDYWFRLSAIQPPLVVGNKLSAFRIHKQSKGGLSYKRQFKEEEQVLKRYTKNRIMVKLHGIHNRLITGIYDQIK